MGVKQDEVKRLNTSLIVNTIKRMKSTSRAEIVDKTKISHTTVRNILKELIENGEVLITGLDESSGGRRAERYIINANKRMVLLLSIERDVIIYKVINSVGESIESNYNNCNNFKDINELLFLIETLITKYKNIKNICISVPGIVTEKGYISGLGINDWTEIKLKEVIKKKFNIPITLENDLNAISLGFYDEYKEKYSTDHYNMIYINFTTLGTGAGIIVNGNLITGKDNSAGEIGTMPIKNSYLNEYILKDIEDNKYIEIIVDTLIILTTILNPNIIVIGGNNFKYDLASNIINKYNNNSNMLANILINKESKKYEFNGLSKIGLSLL